MSTVRDPARLVADASVTDAERTLLRHGIDIAPPPGAEARVWQGLAGALGAAAIGGAAATADASTKTVTAAATKVTGAGLTAAKIVVLVAALAGLAVIGAKLLTSANHARPPAAAPPIAGAEPAAVPAPAAAPPPAELPPPVEPVEIEPAPRASVKKVRAPARPAGVAPAPPSSAGRLREETTLIRDARQALRQGDAARALRLLDECRRLFPAGVLQQERERLAIEALTKSGRGAEASARAAAFLRKYPDSPHAAEIRALGR
ncbi:MAG TPA: outer membrane protein assembly factor BamD [Polyangia bacterium]